MDGAEAKRIIHAYDTQLHRIVCGMTGQTNSTKYVAAVTCPSCRAILTAQEATPGAPDSHGGKSP